MEDWARAVAGFRSDLRMCAEHVRAEFLARTAAVSGLLRDGVSGRWGRLQVPYGVISVVYNKHRRTLLEDDA